MKKCTFAIEAVFGIPIYYDNWYEDLDVELTDEQFNRYCQTLKQWTATDEWKEWNSENGEDYFIKRDLPDIYNVIWETLKKEAPNIWDERILSYLDQINIYTADELWEALHEGDLEEL
jgi:hypothetical protein